MNNTIDFEALENTINAIMIRAQSKNKSLHAYLELLKNFGFRPSEALEKNRTTNLNNGNFLFNPAKKNNTRTLSVEYLPMSFFYYYFGDSVEFQPYYYKRFQRLLRSISPAYNYKVDGKSLGLYIFRYYYVRKLYMEGMSFENITTHMGWKNQFMAFKYVTREIKIN